EGTRFVATFESAEPSMTRVRMEAFLGPKGFAQGLGRLSPLGLEKAMKRTLGEYKRALQGYQPGRARGAVLAALSVRESLGHRDARARRHEPQDSGCDASRDRV